MAKKYKIKMVKFLYSRKLYRGDDWAKAPPTDYHFGNRHTDKLNSYMYNGNNISYIFSDYLIDDDRRYDKKAKFTENEANILLLKYMEEHLADARKEKKRLDKFEEDYKKYPPLPDGVDTYSPGIQYARTINKRSLEHYTEAVKIQRKKVREIKKSKEYLWEQLLK